MRHQDLPEHIERLGHQVIRCAMDVHTALGPGLIERLYEDAMLYELRSRDLRVESQTEILIPYKDITLRGQRIDLIIEGAIIVELKAVEELAQIHRAQLLSYLRAATRRPSDCSSTSTHTACETAYSA